MIYLHIGTHKTGSKSIQQFLADHREYLFEKDFTVYQGCHINEKNHTELHLACLSKGRDSFARLRWPEFQGEDYQKRITRRIAYFLQKRVSKHVIFSNEDLSWLRDDEEINQLSAMLKSADDEVKIILYLRDKIEFLRSYEQQIRKLPGRYPNHDVTSVLYVAPDSWLVDYTQLVNAYSACFGKENVMVIDYDQECFLHKTVLVSFQKFLQLPLTDMLDVTPYYLNKT